MVVNLLKYEPDRTLLHSPFDLCSTYFASMLCHLSNLGHLVGFLLFFSSNLLHASPSLLDINCISQILEMSIMVLLFFFKFL